MQYNQIWESIERKAGYKYIIVYIYMKDGENRLCFLYMNAVLAIYLYKYFKNQWCINNTY